MILGAHFVHLIFYEPQSFINNPIRIFQIGSGLASHGGGLGAIIAVILFARRYRVKNVMRYMDPAMCAATWVIPWVRVGNFFNSEIVGRPWDGPWAVAFPRHDCPGYFANAELCHAPLRHPSQAYEAILGFIMVGIAVYLQRKWRNRLRPGAILFILLAYYFTTRFFIEYVKEYQVLSPSFPLTMGQMLSLPIVLFSLYMLFFSKMSNIRSTLRPEPGPVDEPLEPEVALAGASGGELEAKPGGARKKRKKRKL
jgi:prolipoprotein diacylglyceryl transferase